MAKPTAAQAELRFEKRYEARLREKIEIPEVRDAVAVIQRESTRRWKGGEPLGATLEPPLKVSQAPSSPFWLEEAVCRCNGVGVRVEDRGSKPPLVRLSLRLEVEGQGQFARVQYPQDLLSPNEYDVWEISREGPLGQILEDVEYQWRELYQERQRRRGGGMFDANAPPAPLPTRGRSTNRTLWAIEAYRRRLEGQKWREIALALKKGQSTLRRAVADFSERARLPKPKPGAVLPDAPQVDCDNCTKRLAPGEPCRDCPWLVYADSHLGPGELKGVTRSSREEY